MSHESAIRMSRRLRERFGLAPDEALRACAWPGGYPVYYIDGEDNVLCPLCAHRAGVSQAAVEYDINWEDPELTCDDCGAAIQYAYYVDGDELPTDEQE